MGSTAVTPAQPQFSDLPSGAQVVSTPQTSQAQPSQAQFSDLPAGAQIVSIPTQPSQQPALSQPPPIAGGLLGQIVGGGVPRPTRTEDILTKVVGGGSLSDIGKSVLGAGLGAAGDVLSTKVGPEIPGTSKAWGIATGHRMPWEPPVQAAAPPAGDLVVKFGPKKNEWVGFGPNDPVGPKGETVQQLRQSGWKDEDISRHVQEKGIAPIESPVKKAAPPPGFIEEPKAEDLFDLGRVSTAMIGGFKQAGGMISSAVGEALKASTPYIAYQMYKKATGQPNELSKIPASAVKTIATLLAAGEGEAAEPEAPAPAPATQPTPSPQLTAQPTAAESAAELGATGELTRGKLPEKFKPIQPDERTVVGTEGKAKGLRLVERGGKWFDSTTGEEYKWKVARR